MSTDTIIQFRPLQPGGDLVYVQTPRQDGTLHVEAEDSWDLAEEEAKQQHAVASADLDDERSSTSSASAMISTASTDSSNDDSSDSSSGSSVPAATGTASTASTSSTTQTIGTGTGTAASGANRMNAAVPASADLRARLRANIRAYHCCALISTVLLGAGTVFTLLATNVIQHRDSGYVYPEEIEFDKIMSGIWYGAGAIAGGIGIANAMHHYRRGNL